MKRYCVEIQATITKRILVDASSPSEAYNAAHEMFDAREVSANECYEEETLSVKEVDHV